MNNSPDVQNQYLPTLCLHWPAFLMTLQSANTSAPIHTTKTTTVEKLVFQEVREPAVIYSLERGTSPAVYAIRETCRFRPP